MFTEFSFLSIKALRFSGTGGIITNANVVTKISNLAGDFCEALTVYGKSRPHLVTHAECHYTPVVRLQLKLLEMLYKPNTN